MKRRITLLTIAATLLVFGLAFAPSAQAQGGGRGGGRGARGGQGGGLGGMFGGPGMMMLGGGMNGQRDPMSSAEPILLQRDDVRHELMLDGRQQQELDDLIAKGRQDLQQKAMAAAQEMRQQMRNNGQNIRTMTPEERQTFTQQMQKQMQDTIAPVLADQDKSLESVLTKKQVVRLHQLDLQWRTALSLNDTKLADQVNITPEQRQKVAAYYKEYTDAQQQSMRSIFAGFNGGGRALRGNGGAGQGNAQNGQDSNGAQPGQPGQPNNVDPQAIQDRMQQAQKAIDKARKTGADKVLALLAPEQKAQWVKMTGTPFVFKENTPIPDQNNNNSN
jgi:hypothetical protein